MRDTTSPGPSFWYGVVLWAFAIIGVCMITVCAVITVTVFLHVVWDIARWAWRLW